MISMPPITPNLPACGPLEGLALMYILREQGALVIANSTLSNRLKERLFFKVILTGFFRGIFWISREIGRFALKF